MTSPTVDLDAVWVERTMAEARAWQRFYAWLWTGRRGIPQLATVPAVRP